MKENIDAYIKRKIEKDEMNIPETYFLKVNQTLNQLPEKRQRGVKISKGKWSVAAAACICIFLSGTVIAAVNYYQQRMEQMSGEEKENLVSYVQDTQANADSFSRNLTEQESNRMKELEKEYLSEGRFPQNGLKIVESEDMITEDTVTFIIEESKFILPENLLTDEELLEIIDFIYKRDYSLSEANKYDASIEIQADENVKENAMEQSKELVKNFYESEIEFNTVTVEVDANNYYRLEMKDQSRGAYRFLYDLDKQKIMEMEYSSEIENPMKNIFVEESLFVSNGLEVLKKINDVEINEISACYCDYNYLEGEILERGIVSYIMIKDDGTCYVVKYDFNINKITDLLITSYEKYQQTIDQNKSKREERGIQRKRINFTE